MVTQKTRPPAAPMTDQRRVRAHNLEAVARYVRARGTCSRGEISAVLGFNKATVSSLVGELIDRGLLENGDRIPGTGAGRPSTTVRVGSDRHASIVVEIFPGDVRLSAWSLALGVVDDVDLKINPTTRGAELTLQSTAQALATMITSLEAAGRHILGVVVAVPGAINPHTGVLERSRPLGWVDTPVRERLVALLDRDDVDIHVVRPAALTTIAEWQSMPDCRDMICVHAGEHGIGTGIVVDGSLVSGAHGHAGVVIPDDHLGLRGLMDRADRSIERLSDLLGQGNPELQAAVDAFAARFVDWLVPVVALLDTRVVILAGYLPALEASLVPALTPALDEMSVHTPGTEVEVRLGVNGAGAYRIGGAVMLADRAFRSVAADVSG